MRRTLTIAIIAAAFSGCGGGSRLHARTATRTTDGTPAAPVPGAAPAAPVPGAAPAPVRPRPLALVTDERQGLLAVVNLWDASPRRFVGIAGDPQYVAAAPQRALVTSPSTGAVTLLAGQPLRVARVLRGFGAPHVAEIAPDGAHGFVTDDARGTLTVIGLGPGRVVGTVAVGAGAHHMTSRPDGRRLWIALGEHASTIVVVDTSRIADPRVIARWHPLFAVHDLAFAPDGRTVWISSAAGPDVTVVRASDRRRLFTVPVGPPPQHIAFAGESAYLTSGYGQTLERVSVRSGRILRRVRAPLGSFELSAADGYVTTASLLDGRLAIYTPSLRLLHVVSIGPATRDVEITTT